MTRVMCNLVWAHASTYTLISISTPPPLFLLHTICTITSICLYPYTDMYVYITSLSHIIIVIVIIAVNKRLDDWVNEDRLDIERLQLPRKDSKVSTLAKSSRPASPDVVMPLLSSDPKKFNSFAGRKRKHDSVEVYMYIIICDEKGTNFLRGFKGSGYWWGFIGVKDFWLVSRF